MQIKTNSKWANKWERSSQWLVGQSDQYYGTVPWQMQINGTCTSCFFLQDDLCGDLSQQLEF
jgi:hypothetical protein